MKVTFQQSLITYRSGFGNLSGSHPRSQVNSVYLSVVLNKIQSVETDWPVCRDVIWCTWVLWLVSVDNVEMDRILFVIGQFCRDIIGCEG